MLRLFALLILLCSTAQSVYAETGDNIDEASTEAADKKTALEKKAKAEKEATNGLYLGQIAAIDPKERYLFVKPSSQMAGPRQTFYIDKSTIYRRAGKKSTLSEFSNGENVGIRYLLHNGMYLALGVFYIDGDTVDLADVKMPPGYKRK